MSNTETNSAESSITTTANMAAVQPIASAAAPTFDTAGGYDLICKQAKAVAAASFLPDDFKGKPANCLIAMDMAARLRMAPLTIFQQLYIVKGKPSWASQFLIGQFNSCGRFTAIKYRMTGAKGKGDYGCVAYTTEKATNEVIEGPEVTMAMASNWGPLWRTVPELMLRYRAATYLIRTTAPEIGMGLPTSDELEDINATPKPEIPKPAPINVTPKAPKPEAPKPMPPIEPPTTAIEAQAVDMETGELLVPVAEVAKPVSAPKTKAKPQPAF